MSAAASLNQREAHPIALVDCRAVTLREACITLVALAALAAGVALVITSLSLTSLFFALVSVYTGCALAGLGSAALTATVLDISARRCEFENTLRAVTYTALLSDSFVLTERNLADFITKLPPMQITSNEVNNICHAVLSTKSFPEVTLNQSFIDEMKTNLNNILDERSQVEAVRKTKIHKNNLTKAAAMKWGLDVEAFKTIVACCISAALQK